MNRVPLVIAIILILVAGGGHAADPSQPTRIVVGSELDYPPYALVTEDGQADGFSVDLMKAVCEVMGIDVTFRVGPWSEVRAALENGEIDALALVSYSEAREKVFDFTVPHTMGNGVFFKRKGSPSIESTDELGGKEIVVMRSDATHDWLLRNGVSENHVLTKTVPEALRALSAGKHDYALAPRLVGLLIVNELGLTNLETTGPLINVHGRGYGFAVKEGNSVLLAQFNEGLNIIKATGRYDEIYQKWFGIVDPKGIATAVIVRYAIWGVGGIAVLIGLTLAWIVVLRRTVNLKTAEVRSARDDLELRVEERTKDLQKEITERKQAEEAAREAELELDRFFNISPDLMGIASTDGYFKRVNPSWERTLGWQENELIGKPFVDFIHPDDVDATLREIERQRSGEAVIAFVNRYRCKDGSYRWLEWVATPVVETTIFAIARDITGRKREEMRTNELQMELAHVSRLSTMGEMTAGLAHELNQPLTTITNYVKGTLRLLRSGEDDPGELLGIMELVAEQALRAGDIIHRIRGYIDHGEFDKSLVDVNLAIREVLTLLAGEIHLAGVSLELDLPDSLPGALADPIQIQQVILNLARNATEAMAGQEAGPCKLTIRSSRVDGDSIEIAVVDTGPVVSAEILEDMFDPFFTTKADGLGMGLTISRSIVESHGGRLWVMLEAGKGTAFHFTLPVAVGGKDAAA